MESVTAVSGTKIGHAGISRKYEKALACPLEVDKQLSLAEDVLVAARRNRYLLIARFPEPPVRSKPQRARSECGRVKECVPGNAVPALQARS